MVAKRGIISPKPIASRREQFTPATAEYQDQPEISDSEEASPKTQNKSHTSLRPASQRTKLSLNTRKRIKAIQEAITVESRKAKGNPVIRRGLKKALKKVKSDVLRSALLELRQNLESHPISVNRPISELELYQPTQISASSLSESLVPETISSVIGKKAGAPENMGNSAGSNGERAGSIQEEETPDLVDHEMDDTDAAVDDKPLPFPLTEECHHYTRRADVVWDIQKYWDQRYHIFSRYDEGIYMTDDAWFGVTPEPVANKIADDLASLTPASKDILVDMFAGAGGNVIAFALSNRWSKIVAIEKDASVIACAQNNASIYGVFEKITWVNDDSFSYLESKKSSIDPCKTVVFASPPWGGPGYTSDNVFDLNTMQPYSIKKLHGACKEMNSALYLPRTSDLRQIAGLAPGKEKVEVVQYCMQGASKALVAYIPAVVPLDT